MTTSHELYPYDSEYDDVNDRYLTRWKNEETGIEFVAPEGTFDDGTYLNIEVTQ